MVFMSEVLRFALPKSTSTAAAFLQLRQAVAKSHRIRDQYFGYTLPVAGTGLPVQESEMCWVISTFFSDPSLFSGSAIHCRWRRDAADRQHLQLLLNI
jgi:hypothetical protein